MNEPSITLDDDTFVLPSEENIISTEYIHRVWLNVGKPNRLEGDSAWRVMDAIIAVWFAMFPHEVEAWKQNLKDEQEAERSPHEANKTNGGYFPISYPTRLYHLIRVYFKNDELADRKLVKKFISRYPILQRTKFKI